VATVDGLIDAALEAQRFGRLEDAAAAFEAAAAADPSDWRLPTEAGNCYAGLARYRDALDCYERAQELLPPGDPEPFVFVLFHKGVIQARAGWHEAALETLADVLRLDPAHRPAHAEAAAVYESLGLWRDAIDHFDAAGRRDLADRVRRIAPT
jgi:tetratricopeptide (TPR) repeat protein